MARDTDLAPFRSLANSIQRPLHFFLLRTMPTGPASSPAVRFASGTGFLAVADPPLVEWLERLACGLLKLTFVI